MSTQHVVVDGSNIATEGRSTPSLAQLESAVAELRREFPDSEVTVVVDATFAHRIDPSELSRFETAALRGEYVYPPAGAIGRGDAFLLRIAERVDGIVLSNDSFQEFHGEHVWLFDRGRLLGATPVPGVGWIFVPRTPVRGPRSRVAVRDANRAKERVVKAIAQATKEVVEPSADAPAREATPRSRARVRVSASPQAVNDPMTFISFIADHPLGDEIEATVDSFTSHGAVVRFGEVRCYVPLSGLGSPAPRAAREVLRRGEDRTFVVTALDPFRRGVELALPGTAVVSGRPSDETVAAEVRMSRAVRRGSPAPAPAAPLAPPSPRRRRPAAASATDAGPRRAKGAAPVPQAPEGAAPSRGRAPTDAAATRTRGTARAVAPAATAPAATTPARKTPARKTPARGTPAATTPAATTPARKAPAATTPARKTPAAAAPLRKAARSAAPAAAPARKAAVSKASARKAPAAGAPATTASAPAGRAPAAAPAAARRAPARRSPATVAPATKATAKRAAATDVAAREAATRAPSAKKAAKKATAAARATAPARKAPAPVPAPARAPAKRAAPGGDAATTAAARRRTAP